MIKIYTVDALAGAGKTTSACKWAVRQAKLGCKIAIVQPSRKLIDEFVEKVEAMNDDSFNIKRIDSDTAPGQVQASVIEYLKQVNPTEQKHYGEILFITHSTFRALPYWHNRQIWTIIHDEVISVDNCWSLRIPDTHNIITDHIDVVEHDLLHYELRPKNETELRHIALNRKRDDTWKEMFFSEIASDVLSQDCTVLIRKTCWNQHLQNNIKDLNVRFDCFSLLEPRIFDGFKMVIVMGALMSHTIMNLYWSLNSDVRFVSFKPIQKQLRYQNHDNGERLTIKYMLDENWSKQMRDRPIVEGYTALDYLRDLSIKMFGEEKFIYMANVDVGETLFKDTKNAIKLPNSPYGHNEYQDINNVVVASAINPTPIHYSFLTSKGIDSAAAKNAYYAQLAYQAIMRSSIRNPLNTEPVTVLVPDKDCGDFLVRLFPGCYFGREGEAPRLTKKGSGQAPLNNYQKRILKITRDRENNISRLLDVLRDVSESLYLKNIDTPVNATEYKDVVEYDSLVSEYELSIFASIYSSEQDTSICYRSSDEIIAALKKCHDHAITSKHANALISPAKFDADKTSTYIQVKEPGKLNITRIKRTGTKRGIENIKWLRGIWLDNDACEAKDAAGNKIKSDIPVLTYQEFREIFPDMRFVAMNTASTSTEIQKYRLFIPTTKVMDAQNYEKIILNLMEVLKHHGFYDQKEYLWRREKGLDAKMHGFDKSKFVPNSLFYIPSQSVVEKEASFFIEYAGKELDPLQVLGKSLLFKPTKRDDWQIEKKQPIQFEKTINDLKKSLQEKEEDNPIEAPGNDIEKCPYVSQKRIDDYKKLPDHSDTKYSEIYNIARTITRNAKAAGWHITQYEVITLLEDLDRKTGSYHYRQDKNRVRTQAANGFKDG